MGIKLMKPLTELEITQLNELNQIQAEVYKASPNTYNSANVSFCGQIGGGGTINFYIADKLYCGELEFKDLTEGIAKMNTVLRWAKQGGYDSRKWTIGD